MLVRIIDQEKNDENPSKESIEEMICSDMNDGDEYSSLPLFVV